jgi:hypothetical protein
MLMLMYVYTNYQGGDMTGTRADKLAAGYQAALKYGINGPGTA